MASLLEKYGWHDWLCHTSFSFLVGASHPSEYLERAAGFGYRSLAVTDYDGVYGLARAHLDLQSLRNAERAGAEELRLVHGVEIHLAPDHALPVLFRDTLALVALTRDGYRNLCRIVTRAHKDGKNGAFIPLAELLSMDVGGLAAIQPPRGLVRWPSARTSTAVRERLAAVRACFGGRFYLALSRHLHPGEDAALAEILGLAKTLQLPCLLSQDAYFHAPERKDLSDLLHAVRTNQTLDGASAHMFANAERCLHDQAGIARRLEGLPVYEAALRSARALAEQCVFTMSELRYHYPREMVPEGHTTQSYLEQLVWEAARERYQDPLPERVATLLTHELQLISTLGFADYFLTVWDIVRWARSQGILCQGRGSAANSAICFVLGVTSVDPALFDLLFERFMSVERGDPPDIDVDFEHERREEVIQYIYRRYGRDRAAMVANVITFRRKGALRAVGKALGVGEETVAAVARQLETRFSRHSDAVGVLEQVRREGATADGAPEDGSETPDKIPWRLWGELADRLKGFPRHLGLHSGGFMLADGPLVDVVAQEPATMAGRTVVQWCKDDIEGLGFFKIDVLALGMLTAVRKCFAAIAASYGKPLTLATIPQDDAATYAMIQRADTVGTFQIESRAQMSMLPRLKPRNFYDLVIEVAIIRPGPIQGGMIHPYLRRRDGLEAVVFPDERLRSILTRTLGIPLFQEQVMRVAIAVGGFTPGEANELRRHMGAWSLKGDMGPWLARLAVGMRKNGLTEAFVQSILGQMRGFADYGFPESHAVSFALIAYASAYLKRHYPAAFFMALLNAQPMGFYAPHVLVGAAQQGGVRVLPICVNRSDWDARLENVAEPGQPAVYGIRLGLRLVGRLGLEAAQALVRARESRGGAFAELATILELPGLYRSDFAALAAAGAFHAFGLARRSAIWLAAAAPFCPTLEDAEGAAAFTPETALEEIQQDYAATGVSLGPHPTVIIRRDCWCYSVPAERLKTARELAATPAGRTVDVFGLVLARQSPPSAKGMAFFTLEDETGFLNLVFTPDRYERCYRLVDRQAFLCVRGRVQKNGEYHSLLVTEVYAPQPRQGEVIALEAHYQPGGPADVATQVTARALTPTRNYM